MTPRQIADQHTRRALIVLRVAAGLAESADASVARIGKRVLELVSAVDLESAGRREVTALLAQVAETVKAAYNSISLAQRESVRELLAIEAEWASRIYGGREVSEAAIEQAMTELLVIGAPIAVVWQRAGASLSASIGDAIRQAVVSPAPVRDEIRDAVARARRGAQSIAETSTQAAATAGHVEAAQRNGAVAYRWISVLDGRTTEGCALRNGLVYGLDYQPIGHSIPIERPPPRHFGCRSILIGLLRMPREGDVDFDQTFEQWANGLTPAEQDDLLGMGRADLWRRGAITKRDLVDQRGRVLTLRELRARG